MAGLDALRGVAAFAVVLLHACYHFRLPHIVRHGYLAVDFFFMMSGFVLTHAYEERLRRGLTFAALMRARMNRLYPMVVLGVFLGMSVAALQQTAWQQIVADATNGLFLIPNPIGVTTGVDLFPIDPPLWSLFWEMVASALLAMVLHRLDTRTLSILLGLCFLVLTWLAFSFNGLDIGPKRGNGLGGAGRIGFAFLAGMLLCRWRTLMVGRSREIQVRWLALPILAVFAVPALPETWLFDLLTVAIVFPLLILVGAGVKTVAAPWRLAAVLSYPLYVIHIPVLTFVAMCSEAHSAEDRALWMVAGIVASILCSWLAHRCWDQPARAWLTANRARTLKAANIGEPQLFSTVPSTLSPTLSSSEARVLRTRCELLPTKPHMHTEPVAISTG